MHRTDISITKCIGIILMVVAHSGCPKLLSDAIYQFHMPLFFIMSGMCLTDRHIENILNFIKRKINGVWWPYVKYGVIFLALHNVFFRLNIYSSEYGYLDRVSSLYTFQDYISNLTKVVRMTGSEQLLGGFWFLHALFWSSIISIITLRVIKQKWIALFLMTAVTLIMSILKLDVPIVWITSTTFLAATFFVAGYCFKNVNITKFIYPVAIVAVVLGVTFGAESMHISDSRLILPYAIVAVCATLAVNKFSKFIGEKYISLSNKLLYVGSNTLPIFIWHFITFKVVSLIIIVIYDLPVVMLSKFPVIDEYSTMGWWVIYAIIGTCVPLILSYLVSKIKALISQRFILVRAER